MELTLQFLLMIDTDMSTEEVTTKIASSFPGSQRFKDNSFTIEGNFVEVSINELSDLTLSVDEEDGFLYYPVKLESTPLDKKHTEYQQIKLAQNIVNFLILCQCKVVVCANFEKKIIK
jgi:hypothetical protein